MRMNLVRKPIRELVRKSIKTFALILLSTALSSCTTTDRRMLANAAASGDLSEYARQKATQYSQNPEALVKDLKNIKALLDELRGKAKDKWGNEEADMPSNDKYVKYTDNYQSKAIIDFSAGRITVETISAQKRNADDYKTQLRGAIITTLLSTDDPSATDIFSDETPKFNGEPFLFGQVIDQDGKAIRFQWRAGRFAEYLIAQQLKVAQTEKGQRHSVTFPMVNNHNELRKNQYSEYVLASAARYQVSPTLIYAIIETESSFNPFAVSSSNAYGLMQIIPSRAGKDVYIRIKKRDDQPTRSVLFKPEQNIDIGAAYLHILDDIYLKKITNVQSREYSTISAYNGGAGNVFNTFSSNRERAPAIINSLTAQQVYNKLTQEHPRGETRRYLQKVLKFRESY